MQGDGGEAFKDLDDSENAVTAAHALSEVSWQQAHQSCACASLSALHPQYSQINHSRRDTVHLAYKTPLFLRVPVQPQHCLHCLCGRSSTHETFLVHHTS